MYIISRKILNLSLTHYKFEHKFYEIKHNCRILNLQKCIKVTFNIKESVLFF